MFSYCKYLSDIKPLDNWNVSKAKSFIGMFEELHELKDINPLKNWDVSNGE